MQLWKIDLDHEDGKTTFLHDTLAHDDVITIPSLATKGKYHSVKFSTFTMTLTLNIAKQSFCKTLWLLMMYHQTKFGCKRINGSEDIIENIIL